MKGLGGSFLLGLILICVLLFAYWLGTAHLLVSQWPALVDRQLEHVEGLARLTSPHR